MFRNYFKLAIRNLWKNKVFSLINIIGLSLGMAVCIVIFLFVDYEKSFDAIHTKNIYRLNEVQSFEGMAAPQNVALSMYPMAPALKNDFPEVIDYTRIHEFEMAALNNNGNKVFFKRILWADEGFFRVFNYKLLRGDKNKVLASPNSVVLTEQSAERLFGKEDPVGKSVTSYNMRDTLHFTITGIMQNVPENSHLQFNGLYSLATMVNPAKQDANNWGGNWVVTYLELKKGVDILALEKKIPGFLIKYMDKEATKFYKLFLQPLKDVHGTSEDITHDYMNYQKFGQNITRVFMIIGLIVLSIGCINFINLSTARSSGRAREVGVRKSIGAHRLQLTSQFLGESVLLSLLSMLFALVTVRFSLPFINRLSDHHLDFSILNRPLLFLSIVSGTIVVGIISGLYPALFLSSFRPVNVLKGTTNTGGGKSILRNILVTGQFTCAAFLIIATIFVIRQLNYIRHKDAGFTKDQVAMLPGAFKNYMKLKTALEQSPLVKSVTGSSQRMGSNFHQRGFMFRGGEGPARNLAASHVWVDEDFISLYNIKLVAGKNFSEEGIGREYILNESLAKEIMKDNPKANYESLIGKNFWVENDTTATIVGIAKDFNFNSLHSKIETLCLINNKTRGFPHVSVKIDGNRTKEALEFLKTTYEKCITTFPYSYEFLDEHFENLYRTDEKVGKVVSALGILAIVIACLGLLGLASYSAERRVKEIGVRKVLGASVSNIIALLSGDFLKLVLIANLIAWPAAWLAVNVWLRNYAYHTDIVWWVFVVSGAASLLIALASVASQTFKAAVANPVKSLRIE